MAAPPPQEQPPPYPPPTDYMPNPSAPPPQNAPPQTQYYPQPAQFPPRQDHTTVVVAQPTAYGPSPSSSRSPVLYKCHVCGSQQITRISYEYGGAFWLIFVVLCLLVGIFAFVMFCIDDIKDVHHSCPNCNSTVGVSKGSC